MDITERYAESALAPGRKCDSRPSSEWQKWSGGELRERIGSTRCSVEYGGSSTGSSIACFPSPGGLTLLEAVGINARGEIVAMVGDERNAHGFHEGSSRVFHLTPNGQWTPPKIELRSIYHRKAFWITSSHKRRKIAMNRHRFLASLLAVAISVSLNLGAASAQSPSTVGRWDLGPVWDIAPVHMVLRQMVRWCSGRETYISGDDARLWDPATNTLTSLSKATYDLFCAGHTLMSDGNLFVPWRKSPDAIQWIAQRQHLQSRHEYLDTAARHECGTLVPNYHLDGNNEILVMTGTIDSVQLENPSASSVATHVGDLGAIWRTRFWKFTTIPGSIGPRSGMPSWRGPVQTTRISLSPGLAPGLISPCSFLAQLRDYGLSVMYSPWSILIAGGGSHPPTPPKSSSEGMRPRGGGTPTRWHFPVDIWIWRCCRIRHVLATGGTQWPWL